MKKFLFQQRLAKTNQINIFLKMYLNKSNKYIIITCIQYAIKIQFEVVSMKSSISLKAYAKINLGLDVLEKRSDGYHELKMIMQNVDIYDEIFLEILEEDKIKLDLELVFESGEKLSAGLLGSDNIAYKAAKLIKDRYKIEKGIYIRIEKNIPIAAGMAGGSTDAAAVLKGLNALFELNLNEEDLMRLGLLLGADVPYCILGKTALAQGIGEKLSLLPDLSDVALLVVKPDINVSTKEVYQNLKLDILKKEDRPDIEKIIWGIENKDIKVICAGARNVMETYTKEAYPIIKDIKEAMLKEKALLSLMSGSGPSVFGIFENEEDLKACYKQFKSGTYKNLAKHIYITKTK